MAKFVKSATGTYINVDDIERISQSADDIGCRVRLRSTNEGVDGAEFRFHESASDLASSLGAQYVAALPGYAVLSRQCHDRTFEQFARWQTPVVAWKFCAGEDWPTPVTIEGAWDGNTSDEMLVVQPDGSVISLADQLWKSIEEAYETLRKGGQP
jgi:hypothetical protein